MPSPMANLSFGSQQNSGCKKFKIIASSTCSLRKDAQIAGIPTKQLCGQRRPMNRLRCYMASFRSH
jgi:hypothetical protein